MKQHLVVLTGAGMSAESGFSTFRDKGGLWEQHPIEQVATPEGWRADPLLVNGFYNGLRRQLLSARPNRGHELLAGLEADFDVSIVTQNVDDLHERAGSTRVIHLHGELMKATSSRRPNDAQCIVRRAETDPDIRPDERAADGSLLRPYIVWFGEPVPLIETAAQLVARADLLLIVGTSLAVYPAAGLVGYAPPHARIYVVDPAPVALPAGMGATAIRDVASRGIEAFIHQHLRP